MALPCVVYLLYSSPKKSWDMTKHFAGLRDGIGQISPILL
jgi:hypothetical protein